MLRNLLMGHKAKVPGATRLGDGILGIMWFQASRAALVFSTIAVMSSISAPESPEPIQVPGQVRPAPVVPSEAPQSPDSTPVATPTVEFTVTPGRLVGLPGSDNAAVERAQTELTEAIRNWVQVTLIDRSDPSALLTPTGLAGDPAALVVSDVDPLIVSAEFSGLVITSGDRPLEAEVKVEFQSTGSLTGQAVRVARTRQGGKMWLVRTDEGWKVNGWSLSSDIRAVSEERAKADALRDWT